MGSEATATSTATVSPIGSRQAPHSNKATSEVRDVSKHATKTIFRCGTSQRKRICNQASTTSQVEMARTSPQNCQDVLID